jgi:hypothetical protein
MTYIVSIDVGLRTLAFAVGVRDKTSLKFIRVDSFDVIQDDTINVAKTSVELLLDIAVFQMKDVLEKLDEEIFSEVDPKDIIFVIESQPTGRFARNIKMKCVSHVLQGLIRLQFGKACPINFQNAHIKLQACESVATAHEPEAEAEPEPEPDTKKKTKKAIRSEHYRANKKATVQTSTHMCSRTEASVNGLDVESFKKVWDTVLIKKRDDCADALWQLIGYFVFNRPKKSYAVRKKAKTETKPKKTAKRKLNEMLASDLTMCDDS